jgi:hypothetical protein
MSTPFLDLVAQRALHEWHLVLWPARWAMYTVTETLPWTSVQFNAASASSVPDTQGVYAFLLQPGVPAGLSASYVMYVGRTSRSLRTRFKEYLAEANAPTGRPRIQRLLQTYPAHLHFAAAPIVGPLTPDEVEDALLKSLSPPINTDLPAEVRRIERAF